MCICNSYKPQLTFFPLELTKYGGIVAILNLAMSRGRATTNQTFFAGEGSLAIFLQSMRRHFSPVKVNRSAFYLRSSI